MKILLVDDSGTMRHIQKKALMELGLTEITEAEDGKLALEAIEKQRFDLVLMDWNMPNLTGIEALKRLKANPAYKGIPVVMVTSESEKSHILEAIQSGASSYILKPFTTEMLREKLAPFIKK